MSWIRHLPSICASTLLFCLIGSPLGGFMFLTGWAIVRGHPLSLNEELVFLAATFGAVPAFVTGILAGVLRIHVRALLLLAFIMAPVGAVATAIYLVVFMMTLGVGVLWIDKVILIGGLSSFCCSFLLWRNRPWANDERPWPSAQSGSSCRLRY